MDDLKQRDELISLIESRRRKSQALTMVTIIMVIATVCLYMLLVKEKHELEQSKSVIENQILIIERTKEHADSIAEHAAERAALLQLQIDSLNALVEGKDYVSGQDRKGTARDKLLNMNPGQQSMEAKETARIVEAVEKSKYLITIHSVEVSPTTLKKLKLNMRASSFEAELGGNFDLGNEPDWLSKESQVLYYSDASEKVAQDLANLATESTGKPFKIARGAGHGVIKGQEKNTFFIHLIGS